MIIDILILILLVWAIIKGFRRGLIVGVFSFLAILIGLAAAVKLSAVVADYLGENVKVSAQWLPVLSFAIVFLVVVLLIRLGANLLEKTVELGMLGWVNKLGGMIFYSALVLLVFSVVLFYCTELGIFSPQMQENSITYKWVSPYAPKVVDGMGEVVPIFKNMFADLKTFFGGVADNLETTVSR